MGTLLLLADVTKRQRQGCLRAGDQSPAWIIGNRPFHFTFSRMPKKPTRIEIIEEGDQRFLLKTFADGQEKREPIVKLPRKTRPRPKVDWSRKYSSGLKRVLGETGPGIYWKIHANYPNTGGNLDELIKHLVSS